MRPQRTEFEPIALGDRETTLLMKSILIPRPIAWVGTTDDAGVANLAPHSFFTMVSETPPVVMFSSTGRKDTLANAEATGEFTVSLVSRPQFEEANQTSAGYAPEVSEFEAAAVAQEPSAVVAPPRVASSPAVMECTVERIIPGGRQLHGAGAGRPRRCGHPHAEHRCAGTHPAARAGPGSPGPSGSQ